MSNEKFYQKFVEPKKGKKETGRKKGDKGDRPLKQNAREENGDRPRFVKQNLDKHPADAFEVLQSQFDENKVPQEAKSVLEDFDQIVQWVSPLNSKQLQQLPDNIKALSHQLTDQRSERRLGYLNEKVQLSAYVRYYTWWNLVRLTRLFSNLNAESFPEKDCICLDCGTGPLTIILALWLSRPELRKLNLTWYCLDVSANSMALGEDLYLSLAAKITGKTWKIIRVKGPFGTHIKEKAEFITCANMLNELDQAGDMPPEYQTKKYYEQFKNYGSDSTKYLLIEPGVPKASRTLSLIRERFIKEGRKIVGPCPHCDECPMNGFKAYTGSQHKWCNFAFSTESAPAKLLRLSEKAKLPKERATLCYISVIPAGEKESESSEDRNLLLRVASDPLKIPGTKSGFYACSKYGLILIKLLSDKNITSGDLLKVKLSRDIEELPLDQKSGAKIITVK